MVIHTCNPRIWKAEARVSGIQGRSQLQSELEGEQPQEKKVEGEHDLEVGFSPFPVQCLHLVVI